MPKKAYVVYMRFYTLIRSGCSVDVCVELDSCATTPALYAVAAMAVNDARVPSNPKAYAMVKSELKRLLDRSSKAAV